MPKGNISSDFPEGGGGDKSLWALRLKDDGESAKIRFLTDGDEFYWEYFHNLKEKPWNRICLASASNEPCKLCDESVKTVFQWLAWAYVYHIDHAEPGQGRKAGKVGNRTVYREHINEARLMRYAGMHIGSIKLRFERLGTLLDHEFDWTRSGPKGTQRPVYTLDALEKSKLPKEIAALIVDLPDLEDVAFERVIKKSTVPADDEMPSFDKPIEPDPFEQRPTNPVDDEESNDDDSPF